MIEEFRDFLMRGNLFELAVAFVMGLAFAALVNAFIASFVIPFISMITGDPDFSELRFTVNDAVFTYGSFITATITFVSTAAAIFFLVVKPVNAMTARIAKPEDDVVSDEERRHRELLAAIRESRG